MEDSDHQSAALIDSSDLLSKIFIRLPVTSILRFKSVCKQWRLLLSHKHFTHRYDINFSKSPGLFARSIYVPFDVETRSHPPFPSPDFYNRFGGRIHQSCNGLLLCSDNYNGTACEYYVFNPTTMQLAIIPPLPRNIRSIALAYDQTHCVHYKVVCICDLEPVNNLCQILVYSSDLEKWKICVKSFSVPRITFFNLVYCNGAVYWPPYYRNTTYFYFKIDDEQLQTLPLPEGLVSDDLLMYFGESRGHLHLIFRKDHRPNILIMNVHEMLIDRSGWFVRYQVELGVSMGYNISRYGFLVIDVVRGKEEEETFLVVRIHEKMIRYNVHDKSFRELSYNNALGSIRFMDWADIHRHIETLSSF